MPRGARPDRLLGGRGSCGELVGPVSARIGDPRERGDAGSLGRWAGLAPYASPAHRFSWWRLASSPAVEDTGPRAAPTAAHAGETPDRSGR